MQIETLKKTKSRNRRLAKELRDTIIHPFSSFSKQDLAELFQFREVGTKESHAQLWRSIFRNLEWLNKAVQLGANPVLIGPDLYKYYKLETEKEKQGKKKAHDTYIALRIHNFPKALFFERALFFGSLQPGYTFNRETEEITFSNGIKLNVGGALGRKEIRVTNLKMLVRSRLRSNFCFWSDAEFKLRIVKRPDLLGIGGVVKHLENVCTICCFNLYLPGQRVQQFVFSRPGASVTPVYKDGIVYGEPGWEWTGWEHY